MNTPLVRLSGVSKAYPETDGGSVSVLRDACLDVWPGEKVSLMGPSGSGKSTILALIAGLLRPDEGVVEIDGSSLAGRRESARARLRAERIGIALQSDNLIPFLSACENVELALGFAGRVPRRRRRAAARDLLARFAVDSRGGHLPRHLSGGETQRVAMAVALAGDPALLLADEVVAQLDADTAGRVIEDVMVVDAAVVLVTHDATLADRMPTRYVLVDGAVQKC